MNEHHWREIERIFEAAVEHDTTERAAFVQAACAGDEALRREVERLLAADQKAQQIGSRFLASPLHSAPDTKLGHYRLRHEIARGGMGAVWLAERADEQFEQQVAIKLMRAGSAELQHRFQHERQILADLNHPNIARLLDGGTTADGRPYFVMEYIEGVPLDEYCHQQQLPVRARLQLFRQVCAAVQYAHQHLIIHRDLKPANILVTADGTPKLLDFGVAKLLQPDLTASHHTQNGLTPMTPAYASPEQIRGEKLSTASDVYSLGVVLYELLTGQSPYQLTTNTFSELSKAICEQEPTRPSAARMKETKSDSSLIPHPSSLRGDLDSIVLMALRKEPTARYSSVEQFSADIQRYLDGLPTLARKGTFAYRAVKYVRRYKVPVAAAALLLLSLLGGIGATSRQAQIARAEQAKAEAQRIRAEQALVVADEQRRRAEQALAEVEAERTRAENALTTAEQRRQQAEAARAEANQQRAQAQTQRLAAEAERNVANTQRQRAEQGEKLQRQFLYAAQMKLAHQAWDKANVERTQELLDAQVPQAGQEDLRGFEWYYLWRLAYNDLVMLKHKETVAAIVQTPDGAKLASQTLDGDIRIWETATGKELAPIHDREMNARSLAISPDGKWFAQGKGNGRVNVYAVEQGTRLATLEGSSKEITAVAFSPDGKLLAASSSDGNVGVWAVPSWQPQANFKASSRLIRTIVFSPDSQQLLTGGTEESVKAWHPLTGQEVKALRHGTAVHQIAFLPGTNQLVMGNGRTSSAAIWDYVAGRQIRQISVGLIPLVLACSPDGTMIATGDVEQTVRVFNARTGQLLTTIKAHTGFISALAFTPDGKGVFTGSRDRTLKLSNIQEQTDARLIARSNHRFNNVAFTPDGRQLISTDAEQVIRTHDLQTGKQAQKLDGYQNRPAGDNEPLVMVKVAVSPDGKYFATAGGDGTVRTWDETNERPLQVLRGHTGALYAIAISPDGRYIASGGNDLTAKIWDAASGRELHTLRGHTDRISAAVFSPQGRFLVTSSERTIKLWDYVNGVELNTVRSYTNTTRNLAISPDGKWLAIGGDDRYLAVLDLTTFQVVKTLKGHAQFVTALKFSPDGKRLASGSRDSTVRLWELEQGQEVLTLNGHTGIVMDMAFAPDGNALATAASDGRLLLWPIAPPREVQARSHGTPQPLRANAAADTVRGLLSTQPRPASAAPAPELPSQRITGWFLTGSQRELYAAQTDAAVSLSRQTSVVLMSKQAEIQGFGSLGQSIRAEEFRGRRVRFSGYLKGLAAGKPAGLWFRLDGNEGYSLEFGNTTKPTTTDWQKYEVVLDVPEDSLTLNFGFILNGSGQVWADDFRLEIVDADVPATGQSGYRDRNRQEFLFRPEADRARIRQQVEENAKRLPLKPVNLDFEQ
jgi:WD40 repeat protein/predicted Ser/Thr protein kinase